MNEAGDCVLRSERRLRAAAATWGWTRFADELLDVVNAKRRPHGDARRWAAAVRTLPSGIGGWSIDAGVVHIGDHPPHASRGDDTKADAAARCGALKQLCPWRKGPWNFFGIAVDTEWRSDWKWDRLQAAFTGSPGRVIDVGGGNGYYAFRMIDRGSEAVLNVDPTPLFAFQFEAAMRPLGDPPPIFTLPLADADLPDSMTGFDTALSMGVLSHRRWPLSHLRLLRHVLRPGGRVIVETLVTPEDDDRLWTPPGRYAAMRNVWHLPSIVRLRRWMTAAGFCDVETIDVTETGTAEQRRTDWMAFHSLAEFLDPKNPRLTREGHPRPLRAMVCGRR